MFHAGDSGHERPKDERAARKYMIKQAIKEVRRVEEEAGGDEGDEGGTSVPPTPLPP